MSAAPLATSPIPHYNSAGSLPPISITHASNEPYRNLSPNHLLEETNESSDFNSSAQPKMSSPLGNSDSVVSDDYNNEGADSISSLGTSFSSLPAYHQSAPGRHYMIPIHMSHGEEMGEGTPSSSPVLRPSSGRLVGGMKRLLRIPSTVQQAGVASSSVHAENPITIVTSNIDPTHNPELSVEHTDRKVFINKVFNHIKRPRNHHFSALKRHRIRKHTRTARDRPRSHHHHYSDDGYTSDPGILRDAIAHEEDIEEEEDTESGDPDVEHRLQRITAIENKLEKYKKLLQEEEQILQGFENEYVQGMVGSTSDKETHRLKQKFIAKQSKAKDTIDHLKKKVDKYEEQLQFIKQGGEVVISNPRQYGSKMKSGIKKIGIKGMKNELRERLRRKKRTIDNQIPADEDEDDMEEEHIIEEGEDDMMAEEPLIEDPILIKDDGHCDYCMGPDYTSELVEQIDQQKQDILELRKQQGHLLEKFFAERDKSDRLESELNTLMDLHQHGVTELREQLTQMERLTFSKNQDLEDTIENCQSRLHKLEVEVNKTVDEKKTPVPSSWIRRLFVPLLTFLLDFMSFVFRISEHMGKRTAYALLFVLLAIFVYYFMFHWL